VREFWESLEPYAPPGGTRLAARRLLSKLENFMSTRVVGDAGFGKGRFVLLLGVGSSNWMRTLGDDM